LIEQAGRKELFFRSAKLPIPTVEARSLDIPEAAVDELLAVCTNRLDDQLSVIR